MDSSYGTTVTVFNTTVAPLAPLSSAAVLSISGTSFNLVFPGEGPVTWSIYANDTTQPDGSSGVDAWVNGVCTSGTGPASGLGLPNMPNSASSSLGVTISFERLGIYPRCGLILPRYIVLVVTAQNAVSGCIWRARMALRCAHHAWGVQRGGSMYLSCLNTPVLVRRSRYAMPMSTSQ